MATGNKETFADRVLHGTAPGNTSQPLPPYLLSGVRAAHKMVFTEDAWAMVVYVAYTMPNEIREQARFAVPPYERTWVEFSLSGKRHAFLSDGNRIYIFREDIHPNGKDEFVASPCVFFLHQKWKSHEARQEFLRLCGGITSEELAGYTWSFAKLFEDNSITKLEREPDRKNWYSLIDDHSFELLTPLEDGDFSVVLRESVRFMRIILALFLLLNRPSKPPLFTNVPASRRFLRNKLRPFVAHTIVKFDLSPDAPIRPFHPVKEIVGSSKRHHEVRHHYCHWWKSRRCSHDYIRLAEYPPDAESDASVKCAWECSKCGTVRFRRRRHTRGDSLRGISVQTHEVIDSRSER